MVPKRRCSIPSDWAYNDNAHKCDLLGKYNVSFTFNVANLTPFDVGHENENLDLRTNSFKEREDEVN